MPDINHHYICESLEVEVRVRTSDRTCPGPISCSADVLPFDFIFNLLPHQIFQYHRLKSAILAQHRLDTMLKQRPNERPGENPRAWWKYAIACVMSRPNSRPWEDVLPLVRHRVRYIELVCKKNPKSSRNNGFHGGLSSEESAELLVLEDLMPIEALLAYHKIALRKVYANQQKDEVVQAERQLNPPKESVEKIRAKRSGRFRLPRLATASKRKDTVEASPNIPTTYKKAFNSNNLDVKPNSPSIVEAMTLRLGRKVWFVDWKVHDAIAQVLLRSTIESSPLVHLLLRANGSARSYGIGKRDLLADITQFDILHNDDKVLFVSPTEEDIFGEEDSTSSKARNYSQPLQATNAREGPDMKSPSTFLDLPPPGSVCRVVAGKLEDVIKLSLSAHPATLVWTTSLFKGIADFVSDQSSEVDYDLTAHIRNAATPLARKAQLALLSPSAMSLYVNIAAPKVWIPLASRDKEGTLFMDAGTIRIATVKNEGVMDAHWDFHARDIGVTFVRGLNVSRFGKDGQSYLRTHGVPYAPVGRGETSVVRPLSIDAKSRIIQHDKSTDSNIKSYDPLQTLEVVVSPICLNLVDAEILARSFGKWYAIGLSRVRRRVLNVDKVKEMNTHSDNFDSQESERLKQYYGPRILSITIEKIEMALEGHSKSLSSSYDDRSTISHDNDSLLELAPSTRAYIVEVFNIAVKRTVQQHGEVTRLSISDASIIRLKDVCLYHPLRSMRDTVESENCVLTRASRTVRESNGLKPSHIQKKDKIVHPDIFRASLFHNRTTHADEVEVDVDSVVLRVTPTTLKDCAKAFRRIVELAQLVTKQMERKVHEEGRKARMRDRKGKSCIFLVLDFL